MLNILVGMTLHFFVELSVAERREMYHTSKVCGRHVRLTPFRMASVKIIKRSTNPACAWLVSIALWSVCSEERSKEGGMFMERGKLARECAEEMSQ